MVGKNGKGQIRVRFRNLHSLCRTVRPISWGHMEWNCKQGKLWTSPIWGFGDAVVRALAFHLWGYGSDSQWEHSQSYSDPVLHSCEKS